MTSPCRWTATASTTRCFWRTWCGPWPRADWTCITKEGFQTSFMRRLGINFISVMIRLLCGVRILDTTSGFRACNKELTAYFADHYAQDYPEPEAIITAVLNGYRVGEAPVVMEERMGGKSSISPFKSVYYMVKVSIALVVFRITSGRRKEGRA